VQQFAKWWLDRLGALLLLVAAAPLLACLALLLLLAQGRPLLHREARVGLHEREFILLKFRSMCEGAGPHIAPETDPRITPLGRWLRRSRLDELPQLFNVLGGRMSLVGPRPLPPTHAARLAASERALLFSVRPGMTGVSALAFLGEDAVLGGFQDPETCYLEKLLPAKAALEVDYLAHWSLAEDCALLAATMARLWSRKARQRSRDRVQELLTASSGS
jgi:lipopolysaccharide/colanic/teichoic acid biosynthesis glycosyltransferase